MKCSPVQGGEEASNILGIIRIARFSEAAILSFNLIFLQSNIYLLSISYTYNMYIYKYVDKKLIKKII